MRLQCTEAGLSKREYFASMAMAGFLASFATAAIDPEAKHVAIRSTEYADALIEALNKQ